LCVCVSCSQVGWTAVCASLAGPTARSCSRRSRLQVACAVGTHCSQVDCAAAAVVRRSVASAVLLGVSLAGPTARGSIAQLPLSFVQVGCAVGCATCVCRLARRTQCSQVDRVLPLSFAGRLRCWDPLLAGRSCVAALVCRLVASLGPTARRWIAQLPLSFAGRSQVPLHTGGSYSCRSRLQDLLLAGRMCGWEHCWQDCYMRSLAGGFIG
jgi:hypothetical protein